MSVTWEVVTSRGTLTYELAPVATAPADPGDLPRPVVWDC